MISNDQTLRLERREWLAGAAGLVGLAGATGSAGAVDEDGPVPDLDGTESTAVQEQGYVVEEIDDGLYYITEGVYQMMFLVSEEGVIAVDAPPTIGQSILDAIGEVTDQQITHVVYSHYHADHIAGASLYPDDAEIIAHEKTAKRLARFDDPHRPEPTTTFEGSYTLEVGGQKLDLDYRGPNHSPDNLFVYAPAQRVLMLVDVVFPGWVPFKHLAVSTDIPGYIEAHEKALKYDFDTLVAGHLGELGTPEDVRTQREFLEDLRTNAENAIESVEIQPIAQEVGADNPWRLFDAYLDALAQRITDATLETWGDRLRGADVFMESHAFTMAESLRVDYGKLGPFGLPEETNS